MGDKRIPISEANRDALKDLKRGDDTYDDVIERLLGAHEGGTDGPLPEVAVWGEDIDAPDLPSEVREQLERIESAAKEATDAAQNAERAAEELQR